MPYYPRVPPEEVPQGQPFGQVEQDVFVGDGNKDFSRWHLSSDELIEELEHDLKGEVWANNKWQKKGKKLLNDDGVREIVTLVRGHVNKFTFLAKLSDDDVMDIMLHLDEALIDLLSHKWREFKVELPDLDVIRQIVLTMIYAGMTRGPEGWTMDRVGSIMKTREVVMPQDRPQKRSLIAGFFGRG